MKRLILFLTALAAASCSDSGQPTAPKSSPSPLELAPAAVSRVTDLGTLSGGDYSNAFGINARGQIAGVSNTTPSGQNHAALWTVTPKVVTVQDLGTLGGDFSQATGVNDAGQVAGLGSTASGAVHAALWTVTSKGVSVQDLGTLPGGDYSLGF